MIVILVFILIIVTIKYKSKENIINLYIDEHLIKKKPKSNLI